MEQPLACVLLVLRSRLGAQPYAYLILCGGTVHVAGLSGRVGDTHDAQVGAYKKLRERIMRTLTDDIEKHGNRWLGENDGQSQGRS